MGAARTRASRGTTIRLIRCNSIGRGTFDFLDATGLSVIVSIPEPDAPRMGYARYLEMAERWLTTCSATVCVTNLEAFDNFSDESLADMCTTK